MQGTTIQNLCTMFSPLAPLDRRATHTTANPRVSKHAYTPEWEFAWLCSERRVFSTLLSSPNRFMIVVHPRYTYITQHGVQLGVVMMEVLRLSEIYGL